MIQSTFRRIRSKLHFMDYKTIEKIDSISPYIIINSLHLVSGSQLTCVLIEKRPYAKEQFWKAKIRGAKGTASPTFRNQNVKITFIIYLCVNQFPIAGTSYPTSRTSRRSGLTQFCFQTSQAMVSWLQSRTQHGGRQLLIPWQPRLRERREEPVTREHGSSGHPFWSSVFS